MPKSALLYNSENAEMPEMIGENEKKDYLTTTQAARLMSVSPDTVLKWVKAGKVKSYRTLGGHFRIPVSELSIPLAAESGAASVTADAARPLSHQYCWEYIGDGEVKPECQECITFRSRAKRCYQLKDLPGGLGGLSLMCDTECEDCEYFRQVNGQRLNILVLSRGKNLITDVDRLHRYKECQIQFVEREYEAAVVIQQFRPDYIVVDCALGKRRTSTICRSLFNDIRLPVTRIILSSRSKEIGDFCDKEVLGWIKKPFAVQQLIDCIGGVTEPENENT
jgi:excisionase family DNA binding protein